MTRVHLRRIAYIAAMLCALGPASPARAQVGIGTWVRTAGPQTPGKITMTVEACCNGGRRLIWRFSIPDQPVQTMLVESPFDGREVPVLLNGKPSGETMAIKVVDARHTSCVVKMNGKPFGTSKGTISADGRTLTVENDFSGSVGGNPAGKHTETWVRK